MVLEITKEILFSFRVLSSFQVAVVKVLEENN